MVASACFPQVGVSVYKPNERHAFLRIGLSPITSFEAGLAGFI
jgi:hypothetical protein